MLLLGNALLLAIFTAKLIYVPVLAYVRARYIQGVVRAQATRLLNGYLRAPYEFHLRRNCAELMRKDLWFRYARSSQYALRGINLTIPKGEAIGFVGPSGSGKSTLIDCILGILNSERGHVCVDGRDIQQDLPSWHRTLDCLPQAIS